MKKCGLISISTALCINPTLAKDESTLLDEVVVTAPQMEEPLTVKNDPKRPQQPVPANDGASFLKNIPGFSMIRKGGTDGDPVFRGLAGSRLNLLIDGAELLGGCGVRMDPPTAYVFPEIYDKVTILKGPQTVRYGNGNLAGVVLFDRNIKSLSQPGFGARGSIMGGAWGRIDSIVSGNAGSEQGFAQITASHAEADNYKDGDGRSVHSEYERQSVSGIVGWTPDAHTSITLDAIGSRAEAAYADRSMDGKKFDRHGVGLKAERDDISPLIKRISGQVYYNYIDHVMDNYSMRPLISNTIAKVNNPDRETQGARVAADLGLSTSTLLTIGMDWQSNDHTLRTANGIAVNSYENSPRIRDMETSLWGLYGELRQDLTLTSRVIGGFRYDVWDADRFDKNTGAFLTDAEEALMAGFMRYEYDLEAIPVTTYVGIGHAERPMDYWEASTYNGLTAATKIDQERNTQLDVGMLWEGDDLSASVSLFYSSMDDYILVSNNATPSNTMDDIAMNVDATRWGGEIDGAWKFIPAWTLRGSVVYVRGENDTLDLPLAQTPPLEGRLGVDYTTGPWTFGSLVRMVAKQDRASPGYGNIVGMDLGTTPGFATLALNTSYKPNKAWQISAGVDNLLDKTYAEHVSRGGASVEGFTQTTRINEPGRFWWLKVTAEY